VLKVHVVRQGGYRYYIEDLFPGRAEGLPAAGESPGLWSGAGSAELGVAGTVQAPAFTEVFEGRDPRAGTTLRLTRGERSVAGYDLTFCAPKSVSLLHLLAPGEIAGQVGEGHHAAVAEAGAYLQRAAVGVRRNHHGQVTLLPSTGMVAGQFVHRTSRALDPHLHTHLVVANVAEGVDGVWSSVDSRRVFAHLGAAGGIYHARLRMELTERIGAAWEVPASGLGDVVGVETKMRRLFSQRTAAIDEYVTPRPGESRRQSRTIGAHATRPDKDRTRTVESLRDEWKSRAADSGLDLGELTRVVGRRREVVSEPAIDRRRVCDRLDRLAHAKPSLAQRDVIAAVAAGSTAGAPVEVIESVATRIVEQSGAPVSPVRSGRSRVGEARWAAGDVIRTAGRQPEELVAIAEDRRPALDVGGFTDRTGHRMVGRDRSQALDRFRTRSDVGLER
jgi:conjugative relaxase-like TrwC/TraI family protein